MQILLAILIGPLVFFLVTWGITTAYRVYFPDEPLPFEEDPVMERERMTQRGEGVRVGVREIRADQRRKRRKKATQPSYNYAWGGSDGFPDAWEEDLWRRRN